MKTEKLYKIIEEADINLDFFPLPQNKSVTLCVDGHYHIALDEQAALIKKNERVYLAHELGHCQTGSFYNMYSPFDLRQKHEQRADKWAINKLIPFEELKKAVKDGYHDTAALADYFSVTEDFMKKAISLYTDN